MHGRKKGSVTSDQAEVMRVKAEKFRGLLKLALKNKNNRIDGKPELDLNGKILALNPDVSSLWNHRRLTIEDLKPEELTEDLLKRELILSAEGISKNPKSYPAWHHRMWTLEKFSSLEKSSNSDSSKRLFEATEGAAMESSPESSLNVTQTSSDSAASSLVDWEYELGLCDTLLAADERNFHCWSYRRWVASQLAMKYPDIWKSELKNTNKLVERNFSNYSAWHQRSFILSNYLSVDGPLKNVIPLDVLFEELEYLRQALFTGPYDQSVWIYRQWVIARLGDHLQALDSVESHATIEAISKSLKEDVDSLQSLAAAEPKCKWPLLGIIQASMPLRDLPDFVRSMMTWLDDIHEADIIKKVLVLDPMHSNYYKYQLSKLSQ